VIKNLCILQYSVGALGKCQEFIQLPLQQSFGYMMCSESLPKFFPGDNMAIRLHGTIVIPQDTGSTTYLLGSEVSFIRVRTWNHKKSKLRFNGAKPSIGIKGLLNLAE
jgi:hypothetical protein